VVREEDLQARAKEMGRYLTDGLMQLMEKFESIGDVRGPGLFLGFELVKDRTTLEPATVQAGYLINRMRECGILMSTDGPSNNVIKIKPPMVITRRDIDYLLSTLEVVLGEDSMAV
jgi:4-aminobutyrate aminotransferase-like enzyme